MKAIRTTPYGLAIDNPDKPYLATTEEVRKYLEGKLPCEIEVTEKDEKGKVSKVRVLSESNTLNKTQERASSPLSASPDRETLIIRQSSLKCAIEAKATIPIYAEVNVLDLAESFEKWVLRWSAINVD